MVYRIDVPFNPVEPQIMHVDLNSCFASVEQQANPLLRGAPVAVAAYNAPYGCILAPSVEAKLYGIKTGMTVEAGKKLCPFLIVREADPDKYREIHHGIGAVLSAYSAHVISKSIDEFCLDFSQSPPGYDPVEAAKELKVRIKGEIGEWLRVSVGIGTNQILAKLASGLHKPDGLDVIALHNYRRIYAGIKLQDFCGINVRNEARLNRVGIFTATQFYEAPLSQLKEAFQSVLGRYWYTRLRGYEIDDIQFARRSFGQSYVLPHPLPKADWRPILVKLLAKGTRRMRRDGYAAGGIHLGLEFADHSWWHTGHQADVSLFDDRDLLAAALVLADRAPVLPVKKVAVRCFGLRQDLGQLSLLRDFFKQKKLIEAMDRLNDKWGEYSLTYASFLGSQGHVRDTIAFGK